MKNLLLSVAMVSLACLVSSCSNDSDEMILSNSSVEVFRPSDCNQIVHKGDMISLKSIHPANMKIIGLTYNEYENVGVDYLQAVKFHWLEAQQKDDSTFVFRILQREKSDTVTHINVKFYAHPYASINGTVTFHLVP